MIEILAITASQARAVRQPVLRPDRPFEENIYPGDDRESTFHLGLFEGGTVLGAASVFNEPAPGETSETHWRLRGMAVYPAYQGKGYGGKILELCITYVSEADGTVLWCNARVKARGFYERYGFAVRGEEFDSPPSGPHYLMIKQL